MRGGNLGRAAQCGARQSFVCSLCLYLPLVRYQTRTRAASQFWVGPEHFCVSCPSGAFRSNPGRLARSNRQLLLRRTQLLHSCSWLRQLFLSQASLSECPQSKDDLRLRGMLSMLQSRRTRRLARDLSAAALGSLHTRHFRCSFESQAADVGVSRTSARLLQAPFHVPGSVRSANITPSHAGV